MKNGFRILARLVCHSGLVSFLALVAFLPVQAQTMADWQRAQQKVDSVLKELERSEANMLRIRHKRRKLVVKGTFYNGQLWKFKQKFWLMPVPGMRERLLVKQKKYNTYRKVLRAEISYDTVYYAQWKEYYWKGQGNISKANRIFYVRHRTYGRQVYGKSLGRKRPLLWRKPHVEIAP